jgi:hypothetical protein
MCGKSPVRDKGRTKHMTVKRTKSVSLEELWEYEAKHPVVFASPRALVEARLIADLGRGKRSRHRSHSNGAVHSSARRKLTSQAIPKGLQSFSPALTRSGYAGQRPQSSSTPTGLHHHFAPDDATHSGLINGLFVHLG